MIDRAMRPEGDLEMRNGLTLIAILASALVFGAPAAFAQQQADTEKTVARGCGDVAALQEKLKEDETELQDWANLTRYRESNTKLATTSARERRVVFRGDSKTDRGADPQFGGFFPGKPYVDRGISGQTTPQMLCECRPDAIHPKPKTAGPLGGPKELAG